eukprot:4218218-Amphidinium_carterae.1
MAREGRLIAQVHQTSCASSRATHANDFPGVEQHQKCATTASIASSQHANWNHGRQQALLETIEPATF